MRKYILIIMFLASALCADDAMYLPFRVIEPHYPVLAEQEKIEGYVVVQLDVGEDGRPKNIEIIESVPPDIFDKAVLDAAKKLLYLPTYVNALPVVVPSVLYKYEFKL